MKCAVFASGNGSNFHALLDAFKDEPRLEFSFLFSDNPKAYALNRAQKAGIKTYQKSPGDFTSRLEYEKHLVDLCRTHEVDYILLAGYMRVVGEPLLEAFPMKIINIHPSLLPDFPGRSGIEDAFEAGVSKTGVTVHFIDSGIDTGPIIKQESVEIPESSTLGDLEKKIHEVEHRLYPKVIREILQRREMNGTSAD